MKIKIHLKCSFFQNDQLLMMWKHYLFHIPPHLIISLFIKLFHLLTYLLNLVATNILKN